MLLNLNQVDGALVVTPTGQKIDASNARAFRDALGSIIAQHRRIVLNLAPIQFIDSAGVGTLIACLHLARAGEGEFRLCQLSRPIRALFDLMRMHRVFDIYNDEEEALRGMAA